MCNIRSYTKEEGKVMNYVRNNSEHICFYCKKELIIEEEITLDHVVPVVSGGKTTIDNLVICCKRCNQEKANLMLDEYMRLLEFKNNYIKQSELYSSIKFSEEQLQMLKSKLKNLDELIDTQSDIKSQKINQLMTCRLEKENAYENLRETQLILINQSFYRQKKKSLVESIKIQMNIIETLKEQVEVYVRAEVSEFKLKIKANLV